MNSPSIKVGIVGCGVIGKQHIRAAHESEWIELAGVTDLNPEAARLVARQFEAKRAYDDALSLIADPEIEAVVLAVPTNVRTGLALKAIAAGKHVLLEKPLAMSVKEIERLQEAAAEHARAGGAPLTIAFCSSRFRFLEHAKAARDWIAEGRLGDIRLIRCRVNEPSPGRPSTPQPVWRVHSEINGGGIVANWGIYDFDYLLGLTGWTLRPEWAIARTWGLGDSIRSYFPPDANTETYGTAYIQCADNVALTYERGEFMGAEQERSWQIIGSEGSLTLHMTWPSEKRIVASLLHPETGIEQVTVWEGTEDSSWVDKGALIDFTQSILDNRQPATGLPEALKLQAVMDALYASARSGAPVRMSGAAEGTGVMAEMGPASSSSSSGTSEGGDLS
ncbi:Gfo/Idh/MocA family protein [Cohnella fermenti]|uniref:Gfo/Idh/MocA family oxidoreductase n=1 Tax=Cohnella fermenti TaxID=2565925 RepID=A0A4S4BFE9_9BACL|nr:Gfo/Idh/MocA family oxidoreductase [Cohnella fermenti]THF72902.1 Gfo/Idh/MocA family oxidoreductase [Cohnella fermenti]